MKPVSLNLSTADTLDNVCTHTPSLRDNVRTSMIIGVGKVENYVNIVTFYS
jgi:hypothetical protein